jgi:hypothetical protein
MQPGELLEVEDIFAADVAGDVRTPDRLPSGELRPQARGQDTVRVDLEARMSRGVQRRLTRAELEAASRDRGVPPQVFAPASERVPRQPARGDERFFGHAPHPEDVAKHPTIQARVPPARAPVQISVCAG